MDKQIEAMIAARDWAGMICFARGRIEADKYRYITRYRRGVEAIKSEFQKIYGRPAYAGMNAHTKAADDRIAYYLHALHRIGANGVGIFIDDMRMCEHANPNSLLWFCRRTDGKASRWENIMIDKIYEYEAAIKKEREQAEINLPGLDSIGAVPSEVPPWAIKAAQVYKKLEAERPTTAGDMLRRKNEMITIMSRIRNAGLDFKKILEI
jgi:D-mannonate dehydratase